MAKVNIEELQKKVSSEYYQGLRHVQNKRTQKRAILDKVLDTNLPEGQTRINLLWKNIQLELALFLTDDINIDFLTNQGALGEQIMKNANLVAKYDDVDMDLYEMREDIVNYNARYGLAVTVIDGWDNDEKQPISDSINPLNVIVDPKNYKGSKLRYIGVERRLNKDDLIGNPAYDQKKLKSANFIENPELKKTEIAENNANYLTIITDNEGMVDVYDHFTVFQGKKYLSTWIGDIGACIRIIELEPLTKAEKLKPTKVKFPIQLHRRKPLQGNVFGASIADEVLTYQDNISVLFNLQLLNSRLSALGPDLFVDDKIGIDTKLLGQGKPGGRVMSVSNETNIPIQNGMFYNQVPTPNQYTDVLIQNLERRAEETTNISSQNFGISQNGSQTKAEIQTLQQNANQILIWISNNYLRGQKEYRSEHYRTYALNMGKGTKNISLYQKGQAISLELSKKDFIADGKVQVNIVSKSQVEAQNEKEFNRITFLLNIFLPNITSEYAKNELLRLAGKKSNIKDFDAYKYIRESIDEKDAKENLELLNMDIEVPAPEQNQNPDVYLDIYNQAMDTKAKAKAIQQYTEFAKWKKEQEQLGVGQQQQQGVGNMAVANMAMNNINQEAKTSPSTAGISI